MKLTQKSFAPKTAFFCLRNLIAHKTQRDNASLYELKTIIASLVIRENWSGSTEDLPSFINKLNAEFPNLSDKAEALEGTLHDELELWQIIGAPSPAESTNKESDAPHPGELEGDNIEVTTEIEGKGQMDVEVVIDPEEDGAGADMPIHTFEKAECLEETSGLNRKKDDDDELKDHEEALQEIDMKEVMRSQERPRSIYRSDIILDGLNLEVNGNKGETGIPYPEWDYLKREYKNDWCFLQEVKSDDSHPDWIAETEIQTRHSHC